MSREQENFYRHSTVIVDILRLVFVQFIKHHLSLQGITFQDFVRKYQHEIYHLCFNKFPCCACSPGTTPGSKGSRALQEQQMHLFFDEYGPKLPCHKPGSKSSPKCCSPVKLSITVNILDVSLARVLLVHFMVPKATKERKAIDDLVNIRNASYSHAIKGLMSNDDYTTSIEAITKNLLVIACICKNETEIKLKLNEALKEPHNPAICMQLQTTLLLQIERENEVVQAIKNLTKIVENKNLSHEEPQVSVPESFVRLLCNKEVLEGHDVQLECVVVRSDMEGKWYKDGNEICDSHNMSIVKNDRKLRLDIYGTNLEDRGEYSCKVNGRVTKAFLDVIAFITRTIRNKRCYKGDTVNFLCEVIETETLAQWYKDGVKIDNKRYLIKQIGKIHELTITYADHSDNGCFTVNVNNRTRQATLDVKDYFTKTLRNTSCFEGDTVKFECVVAETGMSAQWYKDGVKIENKRYLIKLMGTTHELTIENAEHSDNGCFAVNVNGRSKQATLNVQAYFTTDIKSVSCTEGENAIFSCDLHSEVSTISWFQRNVEIKISDKYFVQSHNRRSTLEIKNVNAGDSGEISVKVKNCTRKCTLDVRDYFTKTLRNTSCFVGDTVKFECAVAETGMSAQWYKDEAKIENKRYLIKLMGTTHELTIENAEHSDNGCFTVNVNGRSKQATLNVQGKERSKKRKKEEELYEDVRLWKQIRNKTLPMSDLLTRELQEANEKIRKAKVARNYSVQMTLVGGIFFSIFTGGAYMTGALATASMAGALGATGIVLMIEAFVEKDVLSRTQEGINKDKEATYHLITRVRQYRGTYNIPFADSLHRIKLDGIDNLAKDPLDKFIHSFVDTESPSLLKAVDKIIEVRVLLEHELQEVERIQGQHSFS